MNGRNAVFGGTLVFGIALDQLTKAWVAANLEPNVDQIEVIRGWFAIVHAHNTGAAFSTMEGQLALFLTFTAVAIVVIFAMVRRLEVEARFVPFTLGMILSGAVGNGIDRLRQGYVTDFAKAYWGHEPLRTWFIERFQTNVWPIFNVADSMLLIGVGLFLAYYLMLQTEETADVDAPETTAA